MKRVLGRFAVLAACSGVLLVVAPTASARDPLLAPELRCPDPALSAPVRVQLEAMLCFHNYARTKVGRSVLRSNAELIRSARLKGVWIRACGQFSHTACGRSLRSPFSRVGYLRGSWLVGENLGAGWGSVGGVRKMFALWLESPGHRQNLLRSGWHDIGIARRAGVHLLGHANVTLWVVHFGTRSG